MQRVVAPQRPSESTPGPDAPRETGACVSSYPNDADAIEFLAITASSPAEIALTQWSTILNPALYSGADIAQRREIAAMAEKGNEKVVNSYLLLCYLRSSFLKSLSIYLKLQSFA